MKKKYNALEFGMYLNLNIITGHIQHLVKYWLRLKMTKFDLKELANSFIF